MPSELSRRSVLKTTAWSVPVLALAVAAPAASASGITAILETVCLVDKSFAPFYLSATADFIPPNALQIVFTSSTVDLTTVTFSNLLSPVSITATSATLTYTAGVITIPSRIDITGIPTGPFSISATVIGFGGASASITLDTTADTCTAS
jgi:hypothetical protein